jgi:3-phosphoshikimate 1-carboxyvinyltransferase
MALQIEPSSLGGSIHLPSSKSHTLRAILFAALSQGTCHIENYLPSPDTYAMIDAVKSLGASVCITPSSLKITGVCGCLKKAQTTIDCGNSGLVLRLIGALSALTKEKTILTGDHSICSNRPVMPLIDALTQLGVKAYSLHDNHFAPICIEGPFTQSTATIDGADSQPVSGLLIAASFAPYPVEINVVNPGEKPWVDLTCDWLKKMGISFERKGYTYYRLQGSAKIAPFSYTVPGDFSTAAFPIAAALLTQSQITLHNVDMSDVQGDKAIIPLLEKMGAKFTIENHSLTVHPVPCLQGISVDINDMIDALPILAVIGCFSHGKTEVFGAAIARKKESDRISCIVKELKTMGADIEEKPDGFIVHRSLLSGANLFSHHDHRIALSLAVAALAAKTPSTLLNTKCIEKTYPDFVGNFQKIGARIYGL